MLLKKILFLLNLAFSEAKTQTTNIELRTKVLNALRATSEVSEMKVTRSEAQKPEFYTLTLEDLNPKSLVIYSRRDKKSFPLNELSKWGVNSDILSYSFFNSEVPKAFGFSKKFHITYTPVLTSTGSISHFLVYYDKTNFYPTRVTYYDGNKKITTIEYTEYKKIKNKIWRAHAITSKNHTNQQFVKIEFTKIEISLQPMVPRLGEKDLKPSF